MTLKFTELTRVNNGRRVGVTAHVILAPFGRQINKTPWKVLAQFQLLHAI